LSLPLSQVIHRAVSPDPHITGITADSRKVKPGYLFAALPGSRADGRSFIPTALEAGASAVLAPDDVNGLNTPVVHASDLRRAYALAAKALHPAQPETVVAVTGTNGKTSVAAFCRQIFERLGRRSASMGTLGVVAAGEQLTPPGLTTPDAADVSAMMAELCRRHVTHLALEASSHGVDQRRLDGVELTAAAFTNLSQDHLDYHGTMGCYRAAKLRLFETLLPRGRTAVLNADSEAFAAFAATAVVSGQSIFSVGQHGQGLRLLDRRLTPAGQTLHVRSLGEDFHIRLPLAGGFQSSNALVAAGLCIAAGEETSAVLEALEHIEGAPGRMQHVGSGASGGEAYVDYAHTPDGLITVLEALRPHAKGRLVVVFGAGGDRDRGKRVLMGEAAQRLADAAIVTDDNPRSEDPAAIRAEVLRGAIDAVEIGDRRQAIYEAVKLLGEGDVLVVAGKGHEQGQTVGDAVHPFDDVSVVREALEAARG
jgi:UDP-N-acetylmuramoyl-L-alanyl-D-glutamate--2,6-diaminopimelate ligase